MDYGKELDTVQRWIKSTAGLSSWRREATPPTLPRPVIVWESPQRERNKHLHRYAYSQNVSYYGKLYVNSLNEALRIQQDLEEDIEDRCGVLEVVDENKERIGFLKNVKIVFRNTEGLDVPFTLSYEVAYARKRPTMPPQATKVHTTLNCEGGQVHIED